MLGTFATGKTSLVSRFVHGIFSGRYLTTVGVNIEKREVDLGERTVTLVIWDLAGDDDHQQVRASHLRGAAGYVLVVDGTRPATLEAACAIQRRAREVLGDVPFVVALNKADLHREWQIADDDVAALGDSALAVLRTSAKEGDEVMKVFELFARAAIGSDDV